MLNRCQRKSGDYVGGSGCRKARDRHRIRSPLLLRGALGTFTGDIALLQMLPFHLFALRIGICLAGALNRIDQVRLLLTKHLLQSVN